MIFHQHSENWRHEFSKLFYWFSFPRLPSKVPFQHLCMATLKTFLHGDLSALKFSINSVFQTFLLVQFSPSPIQHLCVVHKTFMRGHLCVVTFLHFIQESAKKSCQNRLTHLCVAVVNRLGDSDESPIR